MSKVVGVLVAVVLIGGGGFVAGILVGEDDDAAVTPSPSPTTPPTADPKPTSTPATQTVPDDGPFTMVLPASWKETPCGPGDYEQAFCYRDGGFVLTVSLDPVGSDFSTDTLWRVERDRKRVRIVTRSDCEPRGEELCSQGDGRYDLHVLSTSGGCVDMGAHVFCIHFQNRDEESISFDLVTRILESFRAA